MTNEPKPDKPSNPPGWILSRVRAFLETTALVMVVSVCGAMLLFIVRGWPTSPAPPPVRAPRARPAAAPLPTASLSLDGAQLRGSRAAKVAVIEYSDFQCPYCGRFARDTLPALERAYIEPGKVLFAFREFPLESIHSFALRAAEAAECAGRQGQFWKMHDLNFADQAHLDDTFLRERAKTAGLDAQQFDSCLQGDSVSKVHLDAKSGTDLAIGGTPTFFVGAVQSDGRVKVVKRLSGALPLTDFSTAELKGCYL